MRLNQLFLRFGLIAALSSWGLSAGTPNIVPNLAEVRIVDDFVPVGGQAVIIIELTEPKPIIKGELCVSLNTQQVMQSISTITLLSSRGDVKGAAQVTPQGVDVTFNSPQGTFGSGNFPILIISGPVRNDVSPGQSLTISLDTAQSELRDPQNGSYALAVQQGTVLVQADAVSISDMIPASGLVPAGSFIIVKGVGFLPGVEIDIGEANHGDPIFVNSTELRIPVDVAFELLPTTRVRLRNPDDSTDLFYPAAVLAGLSENGVPVAVNDMAVTQEGQPVDIAVLDNDSDPEGDPISVTDVSTPANGGALTLPGGVIRFQPSPGFVGVESFDYEVSDDFGGSARAVISVTVQGPDPSISFKDPQDLVLALGATDRVEVEIVGGTSGTLSVSMTPDLLSIKDPQRQISGSTRERFRIVGTATGTGLLTATLGADSIQLPVLVLQGSALRIPAIRNDDVSEVGLALTNLSGVEAQIRIKAFGLASPGSLDEAPLERQLSLDLPVGGQTARFLREYDPALDGFRGWIEIDSLQENIFAAFLNLPTGRATYAGDSGSVVASTELTFPGSRLLAGSSPEFSIIRTGSETAQIVIDWMGADGMLWGSVNRTLVGQEALLASFTDLFPTAAQQGFEGYLRLSSDQLVLGYQQSLGDDFIFGHAPGRPSLDGQLMLPHYVDGGGLFTELAVVNQASVDGQLIIRLVDEQGALIENVGPNPMTLPFPGHNQLLLSGDQLFSGDDLIVGALIIEAPPGTVAAAVIGKENDPAFRTAVPVEPDGLLEAVFPQVANGPVGDIDLFTGLAFLSLQAEDALIDVEVFSSAGELLGSTQLTLPGGGRLSRLLSELIEGLPQQLGGHVRIRSSQPIQVLELFGDRQGSFLSTVAASRIN